MADLSIPEIAKTIRVLHVDDDASIQEITKLILLDLNPIFDIDNACCADEGLRKLTSEHYDVVISDYEMPQKNGLEFLKELRKQKNEIPFILFTGKGREDVAVKALNLGADSYINKNGSPETVYCELADAINKTVERKKSRELLAKSESKYHALVENSLQGIAILQTAPIKIVFANSALGKILGYSAQEIMSLSPEGIMSLVYNEDRAVFIKRMENRLRGEPAGACFEFRAMRKEGSIIWLSALANRIDYEGHPAVQGMFLDINESKKAEETVKKSETRYRELANFLPEIVFETDLSGKITFLSQRAFELSGFTPDELEKGLNIYHFVVPEDREKAKENIRRRMTGEETDTSEYSLYRKNGDTYPAIVKTAPIYSENRLIGLRGLVIDITDRKTAEEKLRESQKLNQKVLDCSPNLIYIYDLLEKCNVYANKEILEFLGYTPDQIKSMGSELFAKILHPDDSKVVAEHHARFADAPDNATYEVEYRMKRASGEWRWLRSRDTLFARTREGIGSQILGTCEDISERKKIERALIESEAHYRILTENMRDVIWTMDLNGNFTYVSPSSLQIRGYTAEEAIHQSISQMLTPDSAQMVFKELSHFFETGVLSSNNFELEQYCKDGSTSWIEATITILRDTNGKPSSLLGVSRDITERKKAEVALIEGETTYRSLINGMSDAVWVVDFNGNFVDVNDAAVKVLGFSRNELLTLGIKDVDNYLTTEQANAIMGRVASVGTQVFETIHTAKDGTEIPVEICSSLITYKGKQVVLGIARDISERKKTELELKQYNEVLERVGEGVDAGLAVIGKDYRVVWANKRLMDLGIAPNKKCYDTFNNIGVICPDCGVKKIFENNVPLDIHEYKTVNSKGETVWIELRVTPLKDQNGNTMAALELAVPINERKQIEEKLREQAFLLQSVSDAVISTDSNFAINSWNEGAKLIYGWEEAEVLGKQVQEVLKTQYSESELKYELSKLYQKEEWQSEVIQKHKNGNEIYILSNVKQLKDKSGKTIGAIAVNKDITNLKKAEKFLKESDEKFRKAFETSPDACYISTLKDGVIVEVNDSFSRIWGYSKEECVGKTSLQLGMYAKGPPDRLRMLSELKAKGYFSNLKFDGRRKNGEVFPLLFSGSTLEISGERLIYGVLRDISEQKRAEEELKKKSAKMESINEKLNVVGRLTRHDVGNKLMVMRSNIYLLKKQIGDNPKLAKNFEGIDSAINQSDEMFEFSRFYEKIGVEEPSEIDVAQCFNQAVRLLPNLGAIKVVNDCQGLCVTADSLLKQLFYNFLDNSLKYGEKVTQIRLHYTKDSDGVKLFYEDNGVGIPEANKPKLFQEGFTTGKSTGLGLFLIKKMVEVYGWSITEDGEPGKGIKFIITIPKFDKSKRMN